jgi:hypothetical protein
VIISLFQGSNGFLHSLGQLAIHVGLLFVVGSWTVISMEIYSVTTAISFFFRIQLITLFDERRNSFLIRSIGFNTFYPTQPTSPYTMYYYCSKPSITYYARMKFASGVALVPVPVTRIPLNRGTHWAVPKLTTIKLQSPFAPTGWVRSGRRGACDRGGVRNGSFPPLINGSGVLHTTVPVHVLVASTDQLRQSSYRPIGGCQ